jgi:hypothetical protein
MKRYLLFAWPAGDTWKASTFAGWNCFRGSYETSLTAITAFEKEWYIYEHGQVVDLESADIWHLNQLKAEIENDNEDPVFGLRYDNR